MYELVSIEEFEMTRFLTLKNIETGTVDICFDDSDVVSENNFSFMKRYAIYDCRIKLFGKFANKLFKQKSALLCTVINTSCKIGIEEFVMIKTSSEDIYYISKSEFGNRKIKEHFYYDVGRKDLIQVSKQIHGSYIRL